MLPNLKPLLPRFALATAVIAVQTFPALAAPAQLYNKTIQLNWSVAVSETAPDGQQKHPTASISHTVYVSTAGRLFERSSRSTRAGTKQSEMAPGETQNKGGEARGLHFEGNKLVGNVAFSLGALRFVATFDSSFSSCSLSILYGRETGGLRRKGIDGVMYTINSLTPSGESCSIRDGNPFTG